MNAFFGLARKIETSSELDIEGWAEIGRLNFEVGAYTGTVETAAVFLKNELRLKNSLSHRNNIHKGGDIRKPSRPEPLATNADRLQRFMRSCNPDVLVGHFWTVSGMAHLGELTVLVGADPLEKIVGCEPVPTGLSLGGDLVRV